jgi:putative DNA primase/helicase
MMIDAALSYASRNLAVFPCEKKHPLIASGFKAASKNPTHVREWWQRWPDAQIALPTGKVNRLFVIDVDGPDGASAFAKVNAPETFTVETSPCHFQFWFQQPDGIKTRCSASVIAPQLDTRGDGGYTIAPPSVHHETGKPYRIIQDVPWVDIPSFFLDPQNYESKNGANGHAHVSDAIPKGHRHQTMLSIAGALRARHLSREMVLAQLRIVNARQCVPPLEESEIQKLADYVGAKPAGFPGSRPLETSAAVELECFAGIVPEQVHWLWANRIPSGKFGLFCGEPGKGKSLATIDIAAHVSRSTAFPDGAPCEIGDVIFLSCEDDANDTQAPRLIAAGADMARIHRVKSVKVTLADGQPAESSFSLERDLEKLEESIAKVPRTRLLVIDPVNAYMGRVDTHRDGDVRRVLSPLADLSARLHIATIGVMHLKKAESAALLRVSGSIGFVAAARVVWGFGDDPFDENVRVMVPMKNNIGPLGSALSYRVEVQDGVARIVWRTAVDFNADEVLCSDPKEKQHRRTRQDEAEVWLANLLGNGEVPVTDIAIAAKKAKLAWRTIERAKKNLKVDAIRPGGLWKWVKP